MDYTKRSKKPILYLERLGKLIFEKYIKLLQGPHSPAFLS